MKTKTKSTNRVETLNGNGRHGPSPMKNSFEIGEVSETTSAVTVKAPNFKTAIFNIKGTAPLVIKRFSEKQGFIEKYGTGTTPSKGKKKHAGINLDDVFNKARYISSEGWDGFHAASIRCALIRVCSLVNLKMTLAKMSLFVIADGCDKEQSQIPLVRIIGTAIRQDDIGRLPNGDTVLITRAAYHNWAAKLHIRWDADQFSLQDVTNLLMRVGVQCGIGEGRPFSKESAGCGWGTFEIVNNEQK